MSLNRIKQTGFRNPKAHYKCSLNAHKRTTLPVSQYTEYHFPIICSGNSKVETMLQQILPKHVPLMSAKADLLRSEEQLYRSSSSSAEGPQRITGKHWTKDTHLSQHRAQVWGQRFIFQANRGEHCTFTLPLPNPQIILIQKSIQMVEWAIGQRL